MHRVVITGVLSATLLIGVGVAYAYDEPKEPATVAQTQVEAPKPETVEPVVKEPKPTDIPNSQPANFTPTEDPYPFDPNDGKYHPSVKRDPGIVVHEIVFHEGYRAPGLKALDVHVIARSKGGVENTLVRDRDEIVSVTGSTGKVYNMEGSKGTDVTLNMQYGNFHEERVIQYKDIDVAEKYIDKVVLRRDGELITLDAKDVKPIVTYPPKTAITTTAPAKPKVTTPAPAKTTTPTPAPTPDPNAKTIGKLTIEHHSWGTGEYYGEIVNGKANGQGEAHWRNIPSGNLIEYTWKGNFENNMPMYKGTKTWTDKDGVTKSIYTEVEGIN